MSIIISFLSPLLFITGICYIVYRFFNIPLNIGLLFATCGSSILCFVCGFIDLRIGLYICISVSLMGLVFLLYDLIRQRGELQFIDNVYIAFLVLYCVSFALNSGKVFHHWDEWSHWGIMTKEMYRLNHYYCVDDSVLTAHREYPPFNAIWQYIYCHLYGGLKESAMYNAKTVLNYTILLSCLYKAVEKVKGIYIILIDLIIVLLYALPNLSDGSQYRSIYAEATLIVMTVYTIVYVLGNNVVESIDSKGFIAYCTVMASIVLVKQIGIVFASISLFMLIVYCIKRREARYIMIAILSTALPWILWSRYSAKYVHGGQFAVERFDINNIVDVMFKGNGTSSQIMCITNYVRAIIREPLSYIWNSSYIVLLMLMALLIMVIYHVEKDRGLILLFVTYLISMIAYVPVMLVLYLFGFSDWEMVNLACYPRYMNTMTGIWAIEIVLLCTGYMLDKEGNRVFVKCISCTLVLLALIGGSRLMEEFTPGLYTDNTEGIYESDVDRIQNNTPEASRIYIINQGGNQSTCDIMRYLLDNRYVSAAYVSPDEAEKEAVVQYLDQFDYVFLFHIDDGFADKYGDIFRDRGIIHDTGLYKVMRTDGRDVLKEVVIQ